VLREAAVTPNTKRCAFGRRTKRIGHRTLYELTADAPSACMRSTSRNVPLIYRWARFGRIHGSARNGWASREPKASDHKSRSKIRKQRSRCLVSGFFRSGWMILNVRASATLSPPAIEGSRASVASLYARSSGGRAVR
jgi:hypothetical protein